MTETLPPEIAALGWSILLFLAHMAAQGLTAIRDRGARFNAGPRDGIEDKPLGVVAGRAERAFANYRETWGVFAVLAVALVATGRSAEAGAWLWLGARAVYLPLYLFGVPWLRSVAWGVAAAGLGVMAAALF